MGIFDQSYQNKPTHVRKSNPHTGFDSVPMVRIDGKKYKLVDKAYHKEDTELAIRKLQEKGYDEFRIMNARLYARKSSWAY